MSNLVFILGMMVFLCLSNIFQFSNALRIVTRYSACRYALMHTNHISHISFAQTSKSSLGTKMQSNQKSDTEPEKFKKYECVSCAYVYDEAAG